MRAFAILLGLVVGMGSGGQALGQIALTMQATGANLHFANTEHVYGGTFGFYDAKDVGPISIGGDIRGAILERGSAVGQYNNQALDEGLLGVRVASLPRILGLMPYAEGMLGLTYWRGGVGVTRQDHKHSAEQVAVGVDCKLLPRLKWRVAEATYSRVGAQPGHINPVSVSTGLVVILR